MQTLADTARDGFTWLRDYLTAIKHGRLHPFTAVERKAREATRKDPWGPTGQQLVELAALSHHHEHAQVIFAVLHFRLTRGPAKWRNVYKALLVLEFLLVRGSDATVALAAQLAPLLAALAERYEADAPGHGGDDHGAAVRLRSRAVLELLRAPQQLQQRRAAAAARFGPANMQQPQFWGLSSSSASSSWAAPPWQQQQQQQQGRPCGAVPLAVPTAAPYEWGGAAAGNSSSMLWPPGAAALLSCVGAVPAKAVSAEEAALRVAELRRLLQQPGNRLCADCHDARPSWASISLGVFLCMRCAGVHRGLGTHVSKVRSVSLDTWLPEQVVFMSQAGNAAAGAFFEAALPPGFVRPARDDSTGMCGFIRSKYVQRAWAEPGSTWPPIQRQQQQQDEQQDEQQQQQQQQDEQQYHLGFEDCAFPADGAGVPGAPAAAAAAVAGAAGVADLLCLDDEPPAGGQQQPASVQQHHHQQQQQQQQPQQPPPGASAAAAWDLMDSPMDVPGPSVPVLDWLTARLETGADAAAQAAADAARARRQQQQQHVAAAPAAGSGGLIETYVFSLSSDDEEDDEAAGSAAARAPVPAAGARQQQAGFGGAPPPPLLRQTPSQLQQPPRQLQPPQQQQQQRQPWQQLIPATPGYSTSGAVTPASRHSLAVAGPGLWSANHSSMAYYRHNVHLQHLAAHHVAAATAARAGTAQQWPPLPQLQQQLSSGRLVKQ